MQSGRDLYRLRITTGGTINDVIESALDEAMEQFADGRRGRIFLPETSKLNPGFGLFYNTGTGQFEVEELKVGGGLIELFGHVLNSGSGLIKVLGGYGKIEIINETSKNVIVDRLDVSQRGKGTLIIADLARGRPIGAFDMSTGGSPSNPFAVLQTGATADNNAIVWTAKQSGRPGEQIRIRLVAAGENQSLSISVQPATTLDPNKTITVPLATDSLGRITTTAAQLMAAIQGNSAANALVGVANGPGSNGTGKVVTLPTTNLNGTNAYASIYQWTPSGYTITTDGGIGSAGPVTRTVTGHTAGYRPADGWRYGFTTIVDQDVIKKAEIKKSTWLDFIPLGSSFDSWDSIQVNGEPFFAGSGPYYYKETNAALADLPYTYAARTLVVSSEPIRCIHCDVHKTWWGKRTYHSIYEQKERQNLLFTHTMDAHRDIGIEFIGDTEGTVSVTSNFGGNIIVRGSIVNPTGVTTLDTSAKIVQQGAGSVSGRQIILDAGTGIGDPSTGVTSGPPRTQAQQDAIDPEQGGGQLPRGLRVNIEHVAGKFSWLTATTTAGDIALTELSGDMLVNRISSGNGGDVYLVSSGGVLVAQTSAGVYPNESVADVRGGNITIDARGAVGNSEARPLILDSGIGLQGQTPDEVSIKTTGTNPNVFIREWNGDLWLDTLTTTGTAYVHVPNGKLLDASDFQERDERTLTELRGGIWLDLGLTGANALAKRAEAVLNYISNKNQEYDSYWALRTVATVIDTVSGLRVSVQSLLGTLDLLGNLVTMDDLVNYASLRIDLTAEELAFYTDYYTEDGTKKLTAKARALALKDPYLVANPNLPEADRNAFVDQYVATYLAANLTTYLGTYVPAAIQTVKNSILTRFRNLHTQFSEYFDLAGALFPGGIDPYQLVEAIIAPSLFNPAMVLDAVGNVLSLAGGHGLTTGNAVRYNSGLTSGLLGGALAGNGIVGLVDNAVYFVRVTGNNVTFHNSRADAMSGTNPVDVAKPVTTVATFNPLGSGILDTVANTLKIGTGHGLRTGDAVDYDAGLFGLLNALPIGGLSDNLTYFVGLVGGDKVKLYRTREDAVAGTNAVDLVTATITGLTHTLTPLVSLVHSLTALSENTLIEDFNYVMTSLEKLRLEESIKVWTESELLNVVSANVLKSVVDTVGTIEAANITATSIKLVTSGDIGATTGQTELVIGTAFSDAQKEALSAAERADVSFLSGVAQTAAVIFNGPARTITRTDNLDWTGIVAGTALKITGNSSNATVGLAYYTVAEVIPASGGQPAVIRLMNNAEFGCAPNTTCVPPVFTEATPTVTLLPVALDPTFQTARTLTNIPVFFLNNGFTLTGRAGDTVKRNDGGSFLTEGWQVGDWLRIGGAFNLTTPGRAYKITGVTADTLTFIGTNSLLSNLDPLVAVVSTLIRGVTPAVSKIVIDNRDDIDITLGGGNLYVDSEANVLIGSETDVKVNYVESTGFTRIKTGDGGIFDDRAGNAINFKTGDLVLEAGQGKIGTATDPVRTDLHTGTGLTARAFGNVYIYNRAPGGGAGDLPVEAILSRAGLVRLEADGSIVDHLGTPFVKIRATRVELEADGGIGEDVPDYLKIDVIGSTDFNTLTAVANGNIWLAESDGNMRLRVVMSRKGDVHLKAQFSIHDVVDVYDPYDPWNSPDDTTIASRPRINVIGNDVDLIAEFGTVGTAANDIDIDSDTEFFNSINPSAVVGDGTLSGSSDEGNYYVIEPSGDLYLGSVATTSVLAPVITFIAFITVPGGAIYNGNPLDCSVTPAGCNLVSGKAWLFAQDDIGQDAKHIRSRVGRIEGMSTTGSVFITNDGALQVGGVVAGPPPVPVVPPVPDELPDPTEPPDPDIDIDLPVEPDLPPVPDVPIPDVPPLPSVPTPPVPPVVGGVTSAVNVVIKALSPIVISEDIVAGGSVLVQSADSGANDNVTILTGRGIYSTTSWIKIHSGDDVFLQPGAVLSAATFIEIKGDHTNQDAADGTTILIEGIVSAVTIDVYGEADADSITYTPSAVFGHTRIWGGAGNDYVLLDKLPTIDIGDKFNGVGTGPASIVTGRESTHRRDRVDVDGQGGADIVEVNVDGTTDYIVNVTDGGAENDGADLLRINGTASPDVFLLREQFVTRLQRTGTGPAAFRATYERVNYDRTVNVLHVFAGPGDNADADTDEFYVDDNAAITVLDGGDGNDVFQFGQMFGADRTSPDRVAFGDEIQTVETTLGFLSRGISYSTVAYGGDGEDRMTVFSNKALLKLFGEGGNDEFVVRAFVLKNTNKIATSDTILNGGEGADKIEYNINAPVAIDGGDGVDTVVIIGTEVADSFVITRDGVMGAGLNVSFVAVEKLKVDGMEGDDRFYILSTHPKIVTTIIGGLGSDTFDVGGDVVTPIIALSVEGVSGFINHAALSADPAYNGIFVEGISLNVAGAVGAVQVAETLGNTTVEEGGATDSYTLKLAKPRPSDGTKIFITVAAAPSPSKDAGIGGKSAQVSLDGVNFFDFLIVVFDAAVSDISQANAWAREQTVYVRAINDTAPEGERTVVVNHFELQHQPALQPAEHRQRRGPPHRQRQAGHRRAAERPRHAGRRGHPHRRLHGAPHPGAAGRRAGDRHAGGRPDAGHALVGGLPVHGRFGQHPGEDHLRPPRLDERGDRHRHGVQRLDAGEPDAQDDRPLRQLGLRRRSLQRGGRAARGRRRHPRQRRRRRARYPERWLDARVRDHQRHVHDPAHQGAGVPGRHARVRRGRPHPERRQDVGVVDRSAFLRRRRRAAAAGRLHRCQLQLAGDDHGRGDPPGADRQQPAGDDVPEPAAPARRQHRRPADHRRRHHQGPHHPSGRPPADGDRRAAAGAHDHRGRDPEGRHAERLQRRQPVRGCRPARLHLHHRRQRRHGRGARAGLRRRARLDRRHQVRPHLRPRHDRPDDADAELRRRVRSAHLRRRHHVPRRRGRGHPPRPPQRHVHGGQHRGRHDHRRAGRRR